jgi:hypothetical protein
VRNSQGGGTFGGNESFTPPAGMIGWVDARQQTYSDAAGTVPSNAPNGRVRRINEPSPLTGNWLAASTALSPFRNVDGIDTQCGNVSAMASPAGLTMNGNNFTVGFCGQANEQNGNGTLGLGMLLGASGGGNGGLSLSPLTADSKQQTFTWFVSSAGKQSGILCPAGSKFALIIRGDAANIYFNARLNGGTEVTATVAAVTPATLSSIILGNIAAAYSAQAIIAQCILYNSMFANGSANMTQLMSFLNSQCQVLEQPNSVAQVCVIGDSNSTGFQANTQKLTMFPAAQFSLYSKASPPRFFFSGFPGSTLAQAITDYPSRVSPRINRARTTNLVVIQAGAADMFAGASAAATYALLQTLCNMVIADGGTPIPCTVCPIDNAGVPGFDAVRNTYNGLVAAGFPGANAYIPLGTTGGSGINLLADCSGANFAGDKQHLNDSGETIAAGIVIPVLSALIP